MRPASEATERHCQTAGARHGLHEERCSREYTFKGFRDKTPAGATLGLQHERGDDPTSSLETGWLGSSFLLPACWRSPGPLIWTDIGTVGTALLGIVLFGEAATVVRLVCITLIVVGIVGLELT